MELSTEIALQKLQQYCVYQDRCHSEVRTKLLKLEIYGDALEEVMSLLIQEKFLDEERYARSYARGKFRIKKWGRYKIKQKLFQKQISDYCIRKAMEEIDEDEYLQTLEAIYQKKHDSYLGATDYVRVQKARNYCISRGYEMNLVNAVKIKNEE